MTRENETELTDRLDNIDKATRWATDGFGALGTWGLLSLSSNEARNYTEIRAGRTGGPIGLRANWRARIGQGLTFGTVGAVLCGLGSYFVSQHRTSKAHADGNDNSR